MEQELFERIRLGILPPYVPDAEHFVPGLLEQLFRTANRLAHRWNHPQMATPHLWYAVGEMDGDRGGKFLRETGLAGQRFVESLVAVWPPDPDCAIIIGRLGLSAVARYALNQAVSLAGLTGAKLVDGRHLVVALLGGEEPQLIGALSRLGVVFGGTWAELAELLE